MAHTHWKCFHLSAILIIQFTLFIALIFYTSLSLAQTQLSGSDNETIPVQEFITSATDVIAEDANVKSSNPVPNSVQFSGNTVPKASNFEPNSVSAPVLPPITDPQGFPIFPANPPDVPAQPSEFPNPAQTVSSLELTDLSRTPVPLSTIQFFESGEDSGTAAVTAMFAGGLNESNFIKCARMGAGVCSKANNDADFQQCLNRLKQQPACEQFLMFASMSSFKRNDEVDLVQYYKEGQLFLIHVVRVGETYPGDYYTIGVNGDFMNITSGNSIKGINISRDLRYPEIASRYTKVQLWSIIEQLPVATASPDGGVRLIFRFVLLNGCATCDKAGYANVAYDFSGAGVPQRVSLLSLDPVLSK